MKGRKQWLMELGVTALAISEGLGAGAIRPQQISAPRLGDISPRTGFLQVDTLIAGNTGGAYTVIGGADGGIQMYSEPNKLVFYVSPANGGRLRLGALDKPGITMENGNVHIEGDAIVDGTITAGKLQVGEMARVLLTEDYIRIGEVNDGLFTGLLLSKNAAGGYKDNVVTWVVDTSTGKLASGNWLSGEFVGIELGNSTLRLSSLIFNPFETPEQHIEFRTLLQDEDGNVTAMSTADMFADHTGLVARTGTLTVATGSLPYGWLGAEISGDHITITPDFGKQLKLEVGGDRATISGGWDGAPLFIHHALASYTEGIALDGKTVWILGGLQLPTQPPANPYPGAVYFDVGTSTIKVRKGDGTWGTLAYAS